MSAIRLHSLTPVGQHEVKIGGDWWRLRSTDPQPGFRQRIPTSQRLRDTASRIGASSGLEKERMLTLKTAAALVYQLNILRASVIHHG